MEMTLVKSLHNRKVANLLMLTFTPRKKQESLLASNRYNDMIRMTFCSDGFTVYTEKISQFSPSAYSVEKLERGCQTGKLLSGF
jgi:hypothetical protein